MTRHERLRYEMLRRVRDFGNTHQQQFPNSSTGGKALAIITAAVAEIESHAATHYRAAKDTRKNLVLAREGILTRLMAIARTAREVAAATPEADTHFELPAQKSDTALLTAARAFITKGESLAHRFVDLGLPETFGTELQQFVDRLDRAITDKGSGRTARSSAQKGLTAAGVRGFAAVKTLDVLLANAFRDDKALLAEWRKIRRVDPRGKATVTVLRPSSNTPATPSAPAADPAPAVNDPSEKVS